MLYAVDAMLLRAKAAVVNAFKNERGDVNVVAIVVLIAVAVSLAFVFKNAITSLLNELITKVGEKAQGALDN